IDLFAGEVGIKAPVKVLQRFEAVTVRGFGAAAERALLAQVEFVLEQDFQELFVAQAVGGGLLQAQEAAANRLSHEEFLEILLQDELHLRQERSLSRRTKAPDCHRLKTLEDFDWRFNPHLPRKQIY